MITGLLKVTKFCFAIMTLYKLSLINLLNDFINYKD